MNNLNIAIFLLGTIIFASTVYSLPQVSLNPPTGSTTIFSNTTVIVNNGTFNITYQTSSYNHTVIAIDYLNTTYGAFFRYNQTTEAVNRINNSYNPLWINWSLVPNTLDSSYNASYASLNSSSYLAFLINGTFTNGIWNLSGKNIIPYSDSARIILGGSSTVTSNDLLTIYNGSITNIPQGAEFYGKELLPEPASIYFVSVDEKYVYVGTSLTGSNISIYDRSNPLYPKLIGRYVTNPAGGIRAMAVSNGYIYTQSSAGRLELARFTAGNGQSEVMSFIQSNPSCVQVTGAKPLAITGSAILQFCDYSGSVNNDTLLSIDISNPNSIKIAQALVLNSTGKLNSSAGQLLTPRGTSYENGILSSFLQSKDQLITVDASDIYNMTLVDFLEFPSTASVTAYAKKGNIAVVGDSGLDTIWIIDYTNETKPKVATTINYSSAINPVTIEINGRYATIVDSINDSIITLDITNFSNPKIISRIDFPVANFDLQVNNDGVLMGRTLYQTESTTDNLLTFDIGGIDTYGIRAGSIEAGDTNILGKLSATNGQIGSLVVGAGGIGSYGLITAFASNMTSPAGLFYGYVGINANSTELDYPLKVLGNSTKSGKTNISIWSDGGVEADEFYTHTPTWKNEWGSALKHYNNKSKYENADGTVNHSAFGKASIDRQIEIKTIIGESSNSNRVCDTDSEGNEINCRTVTEKTPIYKTDYKNETVVAMGLFSVQNGQAIAELEAENEELKARIEALEDIIYNTKGTEIITSVQPVEKSWWEFWR